MIKKTKNEKGSVLVFTLFIMMLTLITGISLIATSLSGRRSTLSSGKSVNAFQIADSGLEAALIEIKGETGEIDEVLSDCSFNGDPIMKDDDISGGSYEVRFYDAPADTDPDPLKCSDDISDITRVKSVGTYRNTTRSVETTFDDGS